MDQVSIDHHWYQSCHHHGPVSFMLELETYSPNAALRPFATGRGVPKADPMILICRHQWEALDDAEKQRYPYERELFEWLDRAMVDLR